MRKADLANAVRDGRRRGEVIRWSGWVCGERVRRLLLRRYWMLSAAEITAMQTAAALALPESVLIRRATATSDSMGGQARSWSTVATVTGRVDALGTAVVGRLGLLLGQRIAGREARVISLASGSDVEEGDRLTISGVVYEVQAVLGGSWEIVKQVVGTRLP